MTELCERILNELKAISNETTARIYSKIVVDEEVLGVNRGPLRRLAKTHQPNHVLGLELWDLPILETRLMAVMLLEPKKLTIQDLDDLLNKTRSISLVDELTLDVFESFTNPQGLFEAWKDHPDLIRQRAAWNCEIVLIHRKKLTEKEAEDRLTAIEASLIQAPEVVKYAMNRAMVEIALNYETLTQRILANSAKMGVYKEVMVAKGCTSPYAPDWIAAVQRRNK